MAQTEWMTLVLCVVLSNAVLSANGDNGCPNGPSCADVLGWVEQNPLRIGEIQNPQDFTDAWELLSEAQKQQVLNLNVYTRLGDTARGELMAKAETADNCDICVQEYLKQRGIDPAEFSKQKTTLKKFFSPGKGHFNDPALADASIQFLHALTGGKTNVDQLKPFIEHSGQHQLNYDGSEVCIGGCPGLIHWPAEKLSDSDVTQIISTYGNLETTKASNEPSDSGKQFEAPISFGTDDNFIGIGEGPVDGFRSSNHNGRPALSITSGDRFMTVLPRDKLRPGDVEVAFRPEETAFQIRDGVNVDVEIGDLVFGTRSPKKPDDLAALFGESFLDEIERQAGQGNPTNLELAELFLHAQPEFQNARLQLEDLKQRTGAFSRTVFDNQSLAALGQIYQTQYQVVGNPVGAGKRYLAQLVDEAREGVRRPLTEERAALRDLGNYAGEEALRTIEALQTSAITGRTYSGAVLGKAGYVAYEKINVRSPKRIIINHGGEVAETEATIVAEHATMYWNLESFDDDWSNITAHNVVKGAWTAFKDGNDEIVRIELHPPPQPHRRAILRNDDVDLDMRTDSNDSIMIEYLPDGNITHVVATSADPDPRNVKEVYFGRLLADNVRAHYVRGLSWELFFSTERVESGVEKQRITDLARNRTVLNITLLSPDALYRYVPQDYVVASSAHGEFKPKIVCLQNCDAGRENLVYVREDDFGLLSAGTIENTVINYEGNKREVFDPNLVVFSKDDLDEYSSFFQVIHPFSILQRFEADLLFRLNNEAKRDLRLRESLRRQKELFYQNAQPASFSDLDSKVYYFDNETLGHIDLNFFSYIVEGRRKLVLNRHSYNTLIELDRLSGFQVDMPVRTDVIVDGKIVYAVEPDLSMSPRVSPDGKAFSNITFRSPREVLAEYGPMRQR